MAPSILFIDELDSLPNRATLSERGRDWWTTVITDFLVLLDSAVSDRNGLIVIGATNAIDQIDAAILRDGRLERSIYVGPPDPVSLVGIVRYYLRGELADVDLLPLAHARPGATGAEAEGWARGARRAARRAGRPMVLEDLWSQALPPDRRTADELRRVAAHEAGHAICSTLLSCDRVERVTIIRGRSSGGHTAFDRTIPDMLLRADVEDRVTTLLAGRAAEETVMGTYSTGAGGDASSDLALATNLCAMCTLSFGLGADLSWRGPPDQTLTLMTMDPTLRAAVNADLARLYKRAITLLETHKNALQLVVSSLLRAKTLSGDEVRALIYDGEKNNETLKSPNLA